MWAINAKKLKKSADRQFPGLKDPIGSTQKSGHHFRSFFMAEPPNTFVATATPYRLNDRLAIQRGLFLSPGNVTKPFLDNLNAVGDVDAYQIEIAPEYRYDLGDLLLRLNINQEVLFPGLQGLAMSLRERVRQLDVVVRDGTVDVSCLGRSKDE